VDERLHRAAMAAGSAHADWAVLTSFDSVGYAVGHLPVIEAGASPFAGGPSFAIVAPDGASGLIAPNIESAAANRSWAGEKIIYEGFTVDRPADHGANFAHAVTELKRRLGISGILAVEPRSFPGSLAALLDPKDTVDVTFALSRARATKTETEKGLMRRAAHAAAIGQDAFYRAARPGRTELDIFADIRVAIENFAGERTPMTGDFLSGRERTAAFTGWPIARVVEAGDPLLSDLAPRVGGYWGDSCASAVLGEPTDKYLKLFRTAKSALDRALEIMRPGLIAADLDAELRHIVARAGYAYPHHSGHSLGTAVHEWPRITPYEKAALEADMFIMIEPGAYDPAIGGVRLEWMIEITRDGCRPAAPFDHRPAIPLT
jgi:Xaa-Pro dipeptidase